MSEIGDVLKSPENGMKRINCDNLTFKYNGKFTLSNNGSTYKKRVISTYTLNDYFEFYFYGSKFYIIGITRETCSDKIEVYIDDNLVGYINEKNDSFDMGYQTIVFKSDDLEKKIHYVKIINKSSSTSNKNYFYFDAIDVDQDAYMFYSENEELFYNVTPIMTSNNSPEGYEASSSGNANSDYPPYKAFDEILSTCWTSNKKTGWLQLKFPKKPVISHFVIRNFTGNKGLLPTSFNILGSYDGTNFELINSYTFTSWTDNVTKIFSLGCATSYDYYRIECLSTFNDSLVGAVNVDFLLSVNTPFYLINDNSIIKNYDKELKSLIEVENTDILKENVINNECIYNLNVIKSLIDLQKSGVKILSNLNTNLSISSIKTIKELLIGSGDFSTKLVSNIDFFNFNYELDENSIIKVVISVDSGQTWKTFKDNAWTTLSNKPPLKDFSLLSDEEKQQKENFLTEVLEDGIDIKTITNDFDFNTIKSKAMRFAYGFQIADANSEAILKDIKWQFDSIGKYNLLNSNEVEISQSNENISIKSLKDIELMKINVSNSSEEQTTSADDVLFEVTEEEMNETISNGWGDLINET